MDTITVVDLRKSALERSDATAFSKWWRSFDDRFLKRMFGGDLKKKKMGSMLERINERSNESNESSDNYTPPQFGQGEEGNKS